MFEESMMRKLRMWLTPIITLMLVVILGTASFSWYSSYQTIDFDSTANAVLITPNVPEGDNASLDPIGDEYNYSSNTSVYTVPATKKVQGYAGQTGRLKDSYEDRAYIIYYSVTVSTTRDDWSKLDYAYIDKCTITLADGTVEEHEPDPGALGLDEFRVIFLTKTNYAKSTYYFKEANVMTIESQNTMAKSVSFFVGVQFHDGNANNIFPYSDTKYIGSSFNLSIKFDSSESNTFYKLAVLHPDQEYGSLEEGESYTYENGNYSYYDYSSSTDGDGSSSSYLKQYVFKNSEKSNFDLHAGDRIYPYNALTRTYFTAFENWTDYTDSNSDGTNDTFTLPEAEGDASINDFVFYVKVYSNNVSCYVVYPFETYYFKGGNNGWKNAKMNELTSSDTSNFYSYYDGNGDASVSPVEDTTETMYEHAKDLYTTAFSYTTATASSSTLSTLQKIQAKKGYFNGVSNTSADSWSDGTYTYTQQSSDEGAKGYFDTLTDYHIYYIDVSYDNIFEFCVFDTSDHYYKNSFNSGAGNFKVTNGIWRVYLLLCEDTTQTVTIDKVQGTTTETITENYKYRSIVLFEQIGDVETTNPEFWIKGSMNGWSTNDAYKFTYVDESTTTVNGVSVRNPAHYELTVYLTATYQTTDSTGSAVTANHEFKFSDANWAVSWAAEAFAGLGEEVPTEISALGLNHVTYPLSSYFTYNEQNPNMANIVLKQTGTYKFSLYYLMYVDDDGPHQNAFVYVTYYNQANTTGQ